MTTRPARTSPLVRPASSASAAGSPRPFRDPTPCRQGLAPGHRLHAPARGAQQDGPFVRLQRQTPVLERHLQPHHPQIAPRGMEGVRAAGMPPRRAGIVGGHVVASPAGAGPRRLAIPAGAVIGRDGGPAHAGETAHQPRRHAIVDRMPRLEPRERSSAPGIARKRTEALLPWVSRRTSCAMRCRACTSRSIARCRRARDPCLGGCRRCACRAPAWPGLRGGRFDGDAEPVGGASGAVDQLRRGFGNGLEADVAGEALVRAQAARHPRPLLQRVVAVADDAAGEEQALDAVAPAGLQHQPHALAGGEARDGRRGRPGCRGRRRRRCRSWSAAPWAATCSGYEWRMPMSPVLPMPPVFDGPRRPAPQEAQQASYVAASASTAGLRIGSMAHRRRHARVPARETSGAAASVR